MLWKCRLPFVIGALRVNNNNPWFWQVEDSKTGVVKQVLKKLQPLLDKPPGKLKLDYFSQSNFIGLFVQQDYYKFLIDVTTQFVTELKKHSRH